MLNVFDKISKIIPLVSILILLSSIIKNQIYYDFFGININEYTNLSEFTTLFISDLKFYLIYISSLLIYLPFIYIRSYFRTKYGKQYFSFSLTKKVSKYLIIALIISIVLTIFIKSDLSSKLEWIQIYIIMLFSIVLLYIDKDVNYSQKYCFISCSILLILFSLSKSYIDIERINKGKASHQIQFTNNNLKYNSNSEHLYLGKTKEYIFLYNKKSKTTQIFKTSDINSLMIRKNDNK